MEAEDFGAYSIGQAAKIRNIPAETIRQWERDELIKIPRNENGYRCFTQREIDLISKIQSYRDQKISIDNIREIINKPKCKEMATASASGDIVPIDGTVKAIAEMKEQIILMQKSIETMCGEIQALRIVIEGKQNQRFWETWLKK